MKYPIQSSEDNEQQQLIAWAAWQTSRHPELQLLYHVPNEGKRSVSGGARQKRLGLRAGVPDLCLPVARDTYHGLYIEMKFGKNRPDKNQVWWMEQLVGQGYYVAVCYSCEDAARVIMRYVAGTDETGLYQPRPTLPKGKGRAGD